MTLSAPRRRALSTPWAARAQGDVRSLDLILSARAAIARPGAVWWWGRRLTGTRSAAVCYLCDADITSWSGTTRMPSAAIEAVIAHRGGHVADYGSTIGTDAAGARPTADAHGQEADR